jgi:hypothetical protein
MKNQLTKIAHILDIDQDYEQEEFDPKNYIDIDYLFYELWREQVRERDLIFEENPFEGFDYQLSEEYLINIKKVLSVVSESFTPMQVIALYFNSNYDADLTNCPIERKRFILEEMAGSKNLSYFEIEDFNEFRQNLDKIDPIKFQELTNIIYRSQIIRHLIIKSSNTLETFHAKINDLNKEIQILNT